MLGAAAKNLAPTAFCWAPQATGLLLGSSLNVAFNLVRENCPVFFSASQYLVFEKKRGQNIKSTEKSGPTDTEGEKKEEKTELCSLIKLKATCSQPYHCFAIKFNPQSV